MCKERRALAPRRRRPHLGLRDEPVPAWDGGPPESNHDAPDATRERLRCWWRTCQRHVKAASANLAAAPAHAGAFPLAAGYGVVWQEQMRALERDL